MLLPDHEIRRLCQRNSLLSPFNEEQLNPASYDVTLGTQIMVEVAQTSELQKIQLHGHTPDDPFWIQPGEFFLAETMEFSISPITSAPSLFSSRVAPAKAGTMPRLAGRIRAGLAAD